MGRRLYVVGESHPLGETLRACFVRLATGWRPSRSLGIARVHHLRCALSTMNTDHACLTVDLGAHRGADDPDVAEPGASGNRSEPVASTRELKGAAPN
jgi:hypothetical protein